LDVLHVVQGGLLRLGLALASSVSCVIGCTLGCLDCGSLGVGLSLDDLLDNSRAYRACYVVCCIGPLAVRAPVRAVAARVLGAIMRVSCLDMFGGPTEPAPLFPRTSLWVVVSPVLCALLDVGLEGLL
jgi:hypothetical protein